MTLLTICALLASNWGLASIHAGSPAAGPRSQELLSLPSHSGDTVTTPGSAALLLAQVGDLLRDTIRRQIRQRLETGEFEDSGLGDDEDDQGGDDVSDDNENDNSSPDDDSQDNDDAGQDNSEDTSQDNDDEQSDDDSGNSGRGSGNSGPGSGSVNRGPRGSFDSQF